MRILIYKRTHKGDPNIRGVFGNQDCMGRVRDWKYDAVIGIGGKTPWKEDVDIRYKINWIGIGPRKVHKTKRGHRIVFTNFVLYEEDGQNIEESYPYLFEYMYGSGKRFDMNTELPPDVFDEVNKIIDSARDCPRSPDYNSVNFEEPENVFSSESRKCSGCYSGKNNEL